MNTGPLWLLITASLFSVYAVLSREAMAEFSLSDMEELLRQRKRSKQLQPKVERFAERLDSFLFTFLLINFIVKALAAVAISLLVKELLSFQDAWMYWLSFILAWSVWLLLIDMPLRPIAANHAEVLTLWLLGSWRFLRAFLRPVTAIFALVHGGMDKVVRQGRKGEEEEQAEEDIMASLALGELQGQIAEHERSMIEGILNMADLCVGDVMTPRTEMHAIALDEGIAGALKMAHETGRSRLPVYQENRDNIIGILYAKDLVGRQSEGADELRDLLRKATFVPSSKKVSELLAELRKDRIHLAVVLDEYGGTAGIVTLEDLVEVVFGEIEDEYDQEEEEEVRCLSEDSWDIDARIRVNELNERLGLTLPESENYESLAGLVTSELGCIPDPDQVFQLGEFRFTVTQATDRRVVRVLLERLSEEGG